VDPKTVGELAAARRKVKQAADKLRAAAKLIAETEALDVYACQRVATGEHARSIARLITLALSEHKGGVEVVILISPQSTAPPGGEGDMNGTVTEGAAPAGGEHRRQGSARS
jgi:hypothetical protein